MENDPLRSCYNEASNVKYKMGCGEFLHFELSF